MNTGGTSHRVGSGASWLFTFFACSLVRSSQPLAIDALKQDVVGFIMQYNQEIEEWKVRTGYAVPCMAMIMVHSANISENDD